MWPLAVLGATALLVCPVLQPVAGAAVTAQPGYPPAGCGTQAVPAGPEALQLTGAEQAISMGYDGAGVTVATLADGLDPSNPDLQRNPAYGQAGTPVVVQYRDFSGEGTAAVTDGQEAFGDVSSIAGQGNEAYNVATYDNPVEAAHLPTAGCWVKVIGAAPGADVMALKVLPYNHDTTASAIVQGIQYAVAHGAKVINEPLGFTNFPDTSLDAIREANSAAIAAGVTVVVSSGDGGPNSTMTSPSSGPDVISVGATTSFATYAETGTGGFYNPVVGNGQWVDNNISSFSSGGTDQTGGTLTLVAPGDAGWAICSTNTRVYTGCADTLGGTGNGLQMFGGTSEAAPLVAAAAADVIEAYASTHSGVTPSPALVKQVLTSTATDIGAPAAQQGAGLLNVLGAVGLARSVPGPGQTATPGPGQTATPGSGGATATAAGGILVGPPQLDVTANPGATAKKVISVTNTGSTTASVTLSTRSLAQQAFTTGPQAFTMSPTAGSDNSGTFSSWDGVTEVYQAETFTVPANAGDRLSLSADYQDTGQTSDLHVALFEPDGTYAGYSAPQGLADYAQTQVAYPPSGTWTALFFTEQDGATTGATGTSGPVQWQATTWAYAASSTVTPASVELGPGQTARATVDIVTPAQAGDTTEHVVVTSTGTPQAVGLPNGQATTTIPVVVRASIPLGPDGGTFSGTVSGGDGRYGAVVQTNTYSFQVPPGKPGIEVSVALANDAYQPLVAYLVNQGGKTLATSSNFTLLPSGSTYAAAPTKDVQLYHVGAGPGRWSVVLQWVGPVTGNELVEPFTGTVHFGVLKVNAHLPHNATLVAGKANVYKVAVDNTGSAPEAFFADARLPQARTVNLPNVSSAVKAAALKLPLGAGLTFPIYLVPTHTTKLSATISRSKGTGGVTFDMSYFSGDPDISPGVYEPQVAASVSPASASTALGAGAISPGEWVVNPDETGPYPAAGASPVTAAVKVAAVTQAFDPAVTTNTDDLWRPGSDFSRFVYLAPGQTGTIDVTMRPTAAPGAHVSGTLYIDDFVLASLYTSLPAGGDEAAAIPYSYTVSAPSSAGRG